MEEYIAFVSHKRYAWVEHEQVHTGKIQHFRLKHAPGAIRQPLAGSRPGTPVAPEATVNWYWIVDEIEQADLRPRLVHPREAKLMMGRINKTDRLDAHGLNTLRRRCLGTTPSFPRDDARGYTLPALRACGPASDKSPQPLLPQTH